MQNLEVSISNSNNGDLRRKGDSRPTNSAETLTACELPWGSLKLVPTGNIDFSISPDCFAIKSNLQEIFGIFERKLNIFCGDDNQDKYLNKFFVLSEDVYLENLLKVLNALCEHCLPAVLSTVIYWYEKQLQCHFEELLNQTERRQLGINYIFCLLMVEVLPQLHFFPESCEQSVSYIIALAFKEVAYRDPLCLGANYNNFLAVAERYAEVLGVLSQTHATIIQKVFLSSLSELKKENPVTSLTMNNIIALLMAMKFFRIKTNQISDFEIGIRFLDELGQYFLETKQKDIKHAIAGLLVEILLPVAAQIKTEANIPALIAFVDKLYAPTFELINKKRDKMAAYPLLTCLLCICQSKFFLANWTQFLNSILASLKNKDPKVSRVALESLYRLLWVYVIRNNCEGNTATRNRLESICNSLFPKGNRAVVPRDSPLNIFVKIIHFIAQQKLEYAFKEIIFDLLGCNRAHSVLKSSLYPERMNIGIRALMVIANSLQLKEGPPDMPRSMTNTTTQRLKKMYILRPLTADIARSIGLEQYYAPCRKAFDYILRTLDSQVGKPLMLIVVHPRGKEPDELITSEVKPKLDLFRTCIAAIPRLLPESMSHSELVELLIRMTVHIDEELRIHAAQTLQTLMNECADWREDIIHADLNFLSNQILDTYPSLLDSSLRLLQQLMFTWKTTAHIEKKREMNGINEKENGFVNSLRMQISPLLTNSVALALHSVEGFALAMLCQFRTQTRKIVIGILKEVRQLLVLVTPHQHDTSVIEVLDNATSYVYNKYIEHVPLSERQFWNADFASASDKIASIETDSCLVNSDRGNEYFRWDPWACALSGYCEYRFLIAQCPTAVFYAWPIVNIRLNICNSFIDPSNPQNENRASLLRNSKSKGTNSSICGESLGQDSYLSLWQKYLVMACALAPPPHDSINSFTRGFSPTSSAENDLLRSIPSIRLQKNSNVNVSFYQKMISMLRWEHMIDMRDSVVLGIGSINPFSFESLLYEMKIVLREAMERKADNNARRKKRKDLLRLQIIRILEVAVFRGVMLCSGCIDSENALCSVLADFFDSMRQNLESDQDRDLLLLTNLRLHFAKTVSFIIHSVPADKRKNLLANDKKQSLFFLFTSWCSRSIASSERKREGDVGTYVEQRAIEAMCALLCCGPIFETNKAIGENGYLYGWLETLLDSTNPIVEKLIERTLSVMIDLNDETPQLLEWAINICYCKPSNIVKKCFRSLVMLFSKREYPCEFVSIFILCQMLSADVDPCVSESAIELLHLLRRQFLDDSVTVVKYRKSNVNYFLINQIEICRLLAKTYPKITMSVFSEVCWRVENACPSRRTSMLTLLVAWIENIQLVDQQADFQKNDTSGTHGWGSLESSHLILNNLLYITCAQSAEHSKEISLLWRTLANNYPSNLSIIINYLFTMVILSPDILLPHTKRIICYLMDSCASSVVTILIDHLGNVNELFKANLERCEMPPYYRYQNSTDMLEKDKREVQDDPNEDLSFDKSKKHRTDLSASSACSDKLTKLNITDEETISGIHELPMPAYGGYYSPLSKFLVPISQSIISFSRCNLALLHLCDILRCSSNVDWQEHIPLLLIVSIIGLDSLRPTICRHSRQTIINIILLYANDYITISQLSNILLSNQICIDCTNDTLLLNYYQNHNESIICGETPSMKYPEYRQMLLKSNAIFCSKSELVQAIVFCMSEKMERPLWSNEDITPKQWKIESAEHLGCLVRHLAELLLDNIPLLAIRWTQLAMGMALSSSNRHIAGRCFQIASALCQSPSPWIPGLLSRLVETVGEPHDETQSYVTDILLCLHTTVGYLALSQQVMPSQSPTHARSISYTPALLRQTAVAVASATISPVHDRKEIRHSMMISETNEPTIGLCRSKSATALKSTDVSVGEEDLSALCQLLSISVALLESTNDNEYILALHLLDKILDAAGPDRIVCLQRLAKTVNQLDWTSFSGLVGLIVKGTAMNNGYELSLSLLIKCLDVINEPIMGNNNSLPLIITVALPILLLNFDAPTPLCISVAKAIANHLSDKIDYVEEEKKATDDPTIHLISMMDNYVERSFSRDRFQWAKCVCKYLHDAFLPDIIQFVVLLAEILDRQTSSPLHMLILHIIYLLISHIDNISETSFTAFNTQVIRNISKYLQGPNWKEVLRVLKLFMQFHYPSPNYKENNKEIGSLNDEIPIDDCIIIGSLSPRKNYVDNSALRKYNYNQGKVRERLITLLNASGLRVGLPKSASMIFSQSLHDVVYEASASLSSSTEKVPLEHVGGDIDTASSLNAPDPSLTDSFPRVFREFDFLEAEHDSVSESTESCFNWLSTMRPRSISKVNMETDEQYQDDEYTEIANGQNQHSSNASDSLEASSERTPLPSEIRSEASLSEVESSCDDEINEEEEYAMGDEHQRMVDTSSIAESVQCNHSEISEVQTSHKLRLFFECNHHSSSQSEQQWLSCLSEIANDTTADLTSHATILFSQLFRDCCNKLSSLLRDILHILSSSSISQDISIYLSNSLDAIIKIYDNSPFLFITPFYLRSMGLLTSQKYFLMELHEHYETFIERKEQCIRHLNAVKATMKLMMIGGVSIYANNNQNLELCKSLYKLFFQLLLMSDKFDEMIKFIQNLTNSQESNISSEILNLHRCLLSIISDNLSDTATATSTNYATTITTTTTQSSSSAPITSTTTSICGTQKLLNQRDSNYEPILNALYNKEYGNAICLLRKRRQEYGSLPLLLSEYGCCDEVDVEVLLLMYCRNYNKNSWAVLGGNYKNFILNCKNLKEININISTLVRFQLLDVKSSRDSFNRT